MSENHVAGSYGAVDLSAMAGVPGREPSPQDGVPGQPPASHVPPVGSVPPPAPGQTVSGPLVVDVTAANFEAEAHLSATVPVILIFYSARSLTSNQAVTVLEGVAREFAGSFQVGRVDIDAHPDLAQAVQVKSVPTAIALVAGRPVPLFEGVPTAEQVAGLINELLQVAPQLGVTGRLAVADDDLVTPMPASHEAPRAAEEAEDWDQAIVLWKRVLANSPADKEAKLALARAEFELRQVKETSDEDATAVLLNEADGLFARGDEVAAFDLLLDQVQQAPTPEEKEAARARLVELFPLAVDSDAVRAARTRLATLLMV